MSPVLRTCLLGIAVASTALHCTAQSAPFRPFHLVQRIDETLVGVDAIALDVVDRNHVAGTYFLVHARQPSPMSGYANYVVDCREPMRMATLSSLMPSGRLEPETPFVQPPRRSGKMAVDKLDFAPVHVLDGTLLVAEFSCRASNQPGRAVQIAAQLVERGGPADSASLYCDLLSDTGGEPRRGVEVRFSATEDAIAVNGQWLSSGFLTQEEIVFGSGAQWRVDRGKRTARLVRDDGTVLFTGACDTRPAAGSRPSASGEFRMR